MNADGFHSEKVRRFFLENALYWMAEFHIDALRLDAVLAIRDFSARPLLEERAIVAGRGGRANQSPVLPPCPV
jgi:maltooligosyltrehalose trehalohydrolase